MVAATKSNKLRMAFLLDADNLRRLSKILEENVLSEVEKGKVSKVDRPHISYRVDLSDGTSVSTVAIEEVLNLSNSNRRRIVAISVSIPGWSA